MKKQHFFNHVPHLGTKLFRKISFITALLLMVNILLTSLQAQSFKAVPLDGGGWTSGFAQADNGRIYAYGDVFGAWRTDNGGANWDYLNWGIPDGDIVGYGMAVQKNNADVVYYYSYSAIYKSTNGGTTWTKILSPLGDNNPRFRGTSPIMIRANNPNEIWFAGPRKDLTGWLWRSQDGGSTWSKMGGTAFDSNRTRTLHNVSQYPNQIWVGADDGLHVSTNGGSSFTRVGDLNTVSQIQRFTSGANAGIGLVARGNGTGGVSRITATDFNNAATYTVTESGVVNLYFGYPSGLQIFSDGTASAWNTSGDRHGFSNNGGVSFTTRATTLNTNPVPIWTTAAIMSAKNHPDYGTDMVIEDVTNPNKWIITGGGAAMYSLDKGLSWQYFPNASGIAAVKAYLVGVSRHDVNRIYIPASDIGSAIVTDGGSSGQATRSSCKFFTTLHGCFRIMEGPDANNLVLAGVSQSDNRNLLMKSGDGGVTWNEASVGNLPASKDGITKAVMSISNSNDFLVVLSEIGSPAQRVYRTTNGGTSFSNVNGLPDNSPTGGRYGPQNCFIERDATQANVRYFVARGQNFFKSTDGGSNWSAVAHPNGGGSGAWIWGLCADPVRSGNLWSASDWAGVQVSRDGAQTWTPIQQFFSAKYVSSCDGKIAIWGTKDGDSKPYLWYSSDDGATWKALSSDAKNFHGIQGITVDRNGKVWVSWNSCTVVTPGAPIAVTGVSVTPTSSSIGVGGTVSLSATIAPSNASNQSVTWISGNTAVATVSSSGVVTGVAAGAATITVTTSDGSKKATCAITVTPPVVPTSVSVSPTSATVNVGSTQQLTATINPSNANQSVTWSSNNTAVATVSSTGVVTAIATGSATITVTTVSGSKTATCAITVPAIAVTSVSLSPTSVAIGKGYTSTLTATISPSNASNKNISWSSNNTSIATVNSSGVVTGVAVGSATITVTTADGSKTATCAVTVSPAKIPGTVIGTTGSYNNNGNTRDMVFDGNTTTFFDAPTGDNNWVGLDLGATNKITSIKFYPRNQNYESRMNGGKFQGSNTADFSSGVVDLYTITSNPVVGWTTLTITNTNTFRYVRYLAPNASYGNVAEIEFYGTSGGSSTVTVTGVSLNPTTASIAVGATSTLTATVAPSNATNKNVTWSTSASSVATVSSSGIVTGVAAGSATITVTTTDGGKTATCAVTVTGGTTSGKLTGTVIGTAGSWGSSGNTRDKAFDGNTGTYFDAPTADGNWAGLDLGASNQITSVKFYPRSQYANRMNGGKFQGSSSADFSSGVVDLITISANPPYAWSTVTVTNTNGYRYVRYLSPNGGYGNVAEIEFYGTAKSTADDDQETTIIASNNNALVIIYPNPVSGVLHIANAAINANIAIYSIEGKLITNLKANSENMNIDVANFNKGLYILSIQSSNQNVITRLVVK